jgi:uncharacterized membrane protein YkgB
MRAANRTIEAITHTHTAQVVVKVATAASDRLEDIVETYGHIFLRASLGIVFFWFGVLNFFPGISSAEDLAGRTIEVLTFGLVAPKYSMPVLAAWECAIGIGLILGKNMKLVLALLFAQMAGTFSPLFLFPHETFVHLPYAASLEGQYIIKNIVLVSAALSLWGKRPNAAKAA